MNEQEHKLFQLAVREIMKRVADVHLTDKENISEIGEFLMDHYEFLGGFTNNLTLLDYFNQVLAHLDQIVSMYIHNDIEKTFQDAIMPGSSYSGSSVPPADTLTNIVDGPN
jgi:hypothetical protein